MTVIKGKGSRQSRSQFSFDNVFTSFSTQEEVFEATLEPVIDDVFKGFESTVFAYGQTGAGKSYSMVGYGANKGIVPISCDEIFKYIDQQKQANSDKYQFQVTIQMLEIYNEQVMREC